MLRPDTILKVQVNEVLIAALLVYFYLMGKLLVGCSHFYTIDLMEKSRLELYYEHI